MPIRSATVAADQGLQWLIHMGAEDQKLRQPVSETDPEGVVERSAASASENRGWRRDHYAGVRRDAADSRLVYHLHVHGSVALSDRFASFEHAAARGEELATRCRVRLFYIEQKSDPPFLLKDPRGQTERRP